MWNQSLDESILHLVAQTFLTKRSGLRQHNKTSPSILPILARRGVGGYHRGAVAGKTQALLPWAFNPGDPAPKAGRHNVFHGDGTPYDGVEFTLLLQYSEQFGEYVPTVRLEGDER